MCIRDSFLLYLTSGRNNFPLKYLSQRRIISAVLFFCLPDGILMMASFSLWTCCNEMCIRDSPDTVPVNQSDCPFSKMTRSYCVTWARRCNKYYSPTADYHFQWSRRHFGQQPNYISGDKNLIRSINFLKRCSITPVSYTHLDVYKRQLLLFLCEH